ncbi:MAG: S8 family peptidase [Chloroflexi bacterium]|nr:S8 family peptidase [Chloroflexota bacterium]MCI0646644.1 S8 family peptidase [Chloroflexota bacterium]MCI0729227.1 S8 family peptidase [Chloroflexota bacterium]
MYRKPFRLAFFLAFLLLVAITIPVFGQVNGGAGIAVRGDRGPRPVLDEDTVAQPPPVLGQDSPAAIPDQYIVVFNKGTADALETDVVDTVRNLGGTVHYTYSSALEGFAATMPAAALETIQKDLNIAYIEADQTISLTDTQLNATWGLDRVDQRDLPLNTTYVYNQTGAGVTAYIIDTGIRRTHTQFGGRALHGYTAINDGNGSNDCNGHGTHVSGTVGGTTYGVAKQVTLYAVRVLNCSGSGTNSGVIAGVDWVTGHHTGSNPAVANMSLGGGASTALDTAVNNSINDGVTYAIAAGNSNANACNYSPARVAAAITVGSTTSSDARSSFSNYGTCLDIFAPGSSITSAWYTSDSATNTISGTSMATPHVAGGAALYLQTNPGASPSTVRNAIVNNATSGRLSSIGSGSPNLLLYTIFGGSPPPPNPTPTPPPNPAPCTNCEHYTGSLSGTGDYDYHPNGTYYYSGSGNHQGWLQGPAGTDFDLYLWKWNGFSWVTVAQSISSSSSEYISYNGTSGYYVWRIYSYSGSGGYDFWLDRP